MPKLDSTLTTDIATSRADEKPELSRSNIVAEKQYTHAKRKLTIAHFMPWSGIGGVEIATLRLTQVTSDRLRHIAFCLEDATSVKDSFEKLGVQTVTYTPPEPSIRHAPTFHQQSMVIAHQLKALDVDIVHFAEEKAAYHNSLAGTLARVKIVCHFRVSNPSLPFRQRLCLLPVDRYIFVSKEARDTFAVPVPDRKARVIYDAVEIPEADLTPGNAEVRRELGIPPDTFIAGMLARVNPQKDYITLAAAAAKVLKKHPNTRFLIVGDNSLVKLNREHFKEVYAELERLNITDKFIFTGQRTDVPPLLAAMDVFVLCTHREGFPLSILEAMAMQKPVIATSVGGIPEIVIPGVTGFLHQHGNSEELATAINSMIEEPGTLKQIGVTAREHVRAHYSREQYADQMYNMYASLVQP